MAVVNLGNDQLNINTTTAKGLEKVIGVIARFVLSAQNQTNQLLYGKGGDDPNTKGIQRVIDRGLLSVIEEIANVDFCNLINYVANKGNPKKNTFDPNGPKENATPFQKRIWTVQSYAFKIQQNIDRYYSVFGISTGQDSRQALLGLLTSINLEMENLLSPSIGLNDPEILAEFPQMANATNYLSNAIANLNKYTNRREIPLTEITKILNTIDKLRLVCTTIVNLNAAALIGAATSLLRGKLQEDFNKINKFVTPGPKIIAFLTDLIKKVQNINSTAQKILGYVDTARGIIRIAIFLIKIFNILKTFLLVLPLPSLLTTAGIQTLFSKTYNQVLEEQGTKKLITRLNQINLVLNIIIIFVTSLIVALNSIIQSLTQILLNIKSCGTSSDQTGLEGLNEAERENNLLSLTLDDPGRISGAGTSNSTGNIVDTSFGRGRGRRGNTRRGTGIGQLGGTGVGGLGTGTGVIRPDAATLIPRNGLNGNTLADLALLIERTIGDLTGTRNRLQAFVDSYNRNKNLVDKTFFGYTIDIVTEELVDEGITLRRRYGIARSPQNIIVVETTPTFASLDLIIINEVKTLLISRGFVDLGLGSFGAALGQRGIGLGVNGTALGSAGRSLDRPGVGRQANSLGVGLSGNIATPGGSGFSSAQIKRGQQNLNTTSGRTGNLFNNTRGNENLSGIGNRPGDFVSTGLSDSSNARPGGPTTAEAIASAGGGTGIGGAIGALNAQDSEVIIESLNYLGDPNITLGTADVSATDVGGGSFGTSFGGELSQEEEDDLEEQAEDDAEVNNEVRDFVESVPKGKKLRNKVKEKLKKAIQKLIQKVKGTDPQYGTNKDAQSIVGDVIKNIGG